MRFELRTSFVAGLLVVSFAAPVAAAESAVIDLAPRSGPSKFVTGVDGKPAQIGLAPPARPDGGAGAVTIVPAPQIIAEPESKSDRSSPDTNKDSNAAPEEDAQQQVDSNADNPETAEKEKSSEGGKSNDDDDMDDSSDDTAKAPAAGGACETQCNGG